jgi:hypothetical protein
LSLDTRSNRNTSTCTGTDEYARRENSEYQQARQTSSVLLRCSRRGLSEYKELIENLPLETGRGLAVRSRKKFKLQLLAVSTGTTYHGYEKDYPAGRQDFGD